MGCAVMSVCHGVAWTLVLAFLRADWKRGLLVDILSSLAAALASFLLLRQDWAEMGMIALSVISLMTALAVPEVLHCSRRNAVTAFLLGQSGSVMLYSCAHSIPLLVGMLCAFLALTAALHPYYPQVGWRELLAEPTPPEVRFDCRPWHIDGTLLIVCLGANTAAWLPLSGPAAYIVPLLILAFYWCGLCLVLALVEHRRAVLAATSEKQYREEMSAFMNVIRSQRHDYNFHVRTIAGLAESGDLEACRAYARELVQDAESMNEVLPIRDPAISATIFSFRALAARKGINIQIDVQNDLSRIATNVYETNKVISNLLQNAIDEVSTQADKSYGIWLYILKKGRFCLIHTANRFVGDPSRLSDIFRLGYTTKQGHDGVGLSSVKTLVERNRGLIYTRLDEDIIHFVVKIPQRYERIDEDTCRREG